jgi:protein tyrosine phosphatase (PTP) superfamily phosphohydrolase (DUF442 family)
LSRAPQVPAPPRWTRRLAIALAAYLVVTVGLQFVLIGLAFVLRALGQDPRRDDIGSVHNLRRVDARVWAGAQPDAAQYRELAAHGVRLVIDLRTGHRDDPQQDDVELLRELGVDRLSLPTPDGHVPSRAALAQMLRAIDESHGLVFVHCGGGVGRSASAQAAYVAASGRNPEWASLCALGPMSIEQMWFVVAAGPGDAHRTNPVVRPVSEAFDAPRRAWSRVGALLH